MNILWLELYYTSVLAAFMISIVTLIFDTSSNDDSFREKKDYSVKEKLAIFAIAFVCVITPFLNLLFSYYVVKLSLLDELRDV